MVDLMAPVIERFTVVKFPPPAVFKSQFGQY